MVRMRETAEHRSPAFSFELIPELRHFINDETRRVKQEENENQYGNNERDECVNIGPTCCDYLIVDGFMDDPGPSDQLVQRVK